MCCSDLPRPAMGLGILSIYNPTGVGLHSRRATSKNYKHTIKDTMKLSHQNFCLTSVFCKNGCLTKYCLKQEDGECPQHGVSRIYTLTLSQFGCLIPLSRSDNANTDQAVPAELCYLHSLVIVAEKNTSCSADA